VKDEQALFLAGYGRSRGVRAQSTTAPQCVQLVSLRGPDTIANFEAEFGAKVRYATYESNEEMLAKVVTGNSGWDVVFPTSTRLKPMLEYGLLQPLRHEWLPGLGNLDSRFGAPVWDRELQWSIPYMWFGTGIGLQPRRPARPETLGRFMGHTLQGPLDHAR
jgi:spermidine/putrescine transport system substrate-binding protein